MMVLFNPTNETLTAMYGGEEMIIPPAPDPNHMVRVDDPRGRAVVNQLQDRGLVTLEFGDEGEGVEKKAEIGRNKNKSFKRKNVMNYNAESDRRLQVKLPYTPPTPEVQRYAMELGIKLFEPYSQSDEQAERTANLVKSLEERDRKIAEKDRDLAVMAAKMDRMESMLQQIISSGVASVGKGVDGGAVATGTDNGGRPAAEELGPEWDDTRKKIKGLNRVHFGLWVATNYDDILAFPQALLSDVREKYERMYQLKFPSDAGQAQAFAETLATG